MVEKPRADAITWIFLASKFIRVRLCSHNMGVNSKEVQTLLNLDQDIDAF